MNRFNFGNVVTNAMQIESVAGTTAAAGQRRALADAASALNNMTEGQLRDYGAMRASKMMDEVKEYEAGAASPTQHLTLNELRQYQQKRAESIRKYTLGDEEDDFDIDEIMQFSGSPQDSERIKNAQNNINWMNEYRKNANEKLTTIDDIVVASRRGDNNADG